MILKRILNRPNFVWRGAPVKRLTLSFRKTAGKNNTGRITIFHRGGGVKKRYRFVDFSNRLLDVPAKVRRIEYDPIRSAYIALIVYQNGILSYVLATSGLRIGNTIISSKRLDIPLNVGTSVPLSRVVPGTSISSIEMYPGSGAVISRSAGCFSTLLRHVGFDFSIIRLSSGEERVLSSLCFCTIGQISNEENYHNKLGKAGISRHFGLRPIVRGVAMNPIDHPHGGGQGKSTAGRHPVSPWGILTKGFRTVRLRPHSILKSRFL